MNEQNLSYLKDNLKFLGFGDKLYTELENKMSQGKADFTLAGNAVYGKDSIDTTLYFRKSDTTDMYFLNRYEAAVHQEGKEAISQTFYLDKGRGITLKEAYNLLEGRSVHKELTNKDGESYKAWLKLNFSERDPKGNFKVQQFHENYGYDLHEQISNLRLAGMNDEKMDQLVRSLERGNIQAVGVNKGDIEMHVFINANPQYKSLDIYDRNMLPLRKDEKLEITFPKQDNGLDQSLAHKSESPAEEKKSEKLLGPPEDSEKKLSKKPKMEAGESDLLPKKKSRNKGLAI